MKVRSVDILTITITVAGPSWGWTEAEKEGTTFHWEDVGILLTQSQGLGLNIRNNMGRCGTTECYALGHLNK